MLIKIFAAVSLWLIPSFLLLVFLYSAASGIKLFDSFVEGAKEGFWLALRLMPYIVGIYLAIGIFRASGTMDLFAEILKPILKIFGVPTEVLPLFIVKPLSGPASLGLTADLIEQYGPDSFIGRLASTLYGSSDTTLYILTIYFASVGVKRARYSLPVGLMSDAAGFCAAVYICNHVFK